MKAMNDYALSCENYDKTSKAVFAALAYSLAVRLTGEEDHDAALAILRDEWRTLHEQGIVPQRPPNAHGDGSGASPDTVRRDVGNSGGATC